MSVTEFGICGVWCAVVWLVSGRKGVGSCRPAFVVLGGVLVMA